MLAKGSGTLADAVRNRATAALRIGLDGCSPPTLACGSIIKGHLSDLVTMTPLSMEKASLGSFAMVHPRIWTGSDKVCASEKDSDDGIALDMSISPHISMHCCRYFAMNDPR